MNAFAFERFSMLAQARLRRAPPEPGEIMPRSRSDFDDQATMMAMPDELTLTQAAVLVPIVKRPEGASVLLTMRAASLRSHSAQIAFPGGKIDADDATAVDAALREAEEEIGLDRSLVTPLGFLDAYLTGSGYRIVPVVAAVEPDYTLALNPGEVAEAFEAPLGFLMNPDNHARHGREWRGVWRSYYAMPYGERYIWGATAGILRNLHDRLLGAGVSTGEFPA